MPSLIFSDGTSSGFNWQVTGLSSAWNSTNYTRIVLSSGSTTDGSTTAPSGIVSVVSPPSSGSNTFTPKTFIGGSSGTTYSRNAYAQAANGRYYFVGSDSITLPSDAPNPPSGISFSVSGKSITAYWTKGSGAYDTRLDFSWISGAYDVTTTGTSYTFTVPEYNTQYGVDFISFNGDGSRSSSWTGFKYFTSGSPPPDTSNPSISYVAETVRNTRISLSWTSSDNVGVTQHQVFISKKNQASLFYKTTLTGSATTYDFEYDADGLPLVGGATYTVGVRAYDAAGNFSTMLSITRTTPKNRPSNWSWFTSKTSGGSFNLTFDEWNKFCSRINDFRDYHNLSSYGFTNAVQGETFFAYMYNQARTAIVDLPRTISLPSSVSSMQDLTASSLNGLRDALNSTTTL